MTRDAWIKLFDELYQVAWYKKDVLELSREVRADGMAMGLLMRDRNGNTKLSRKGSKLFKQGD